MRKRIQLLQESFLLLVTAAYPARLTWRRCSRSSVLPMRRPGSGRCTGSARARRDSECMSGSAARCGVRMENLGPRRSYGVPAVACGGRLSPGTWFGCPRYAPGATPNVRLKALLKENSVA